VSLWEHIAEEWHALSCPSDTNVIQCIKNQKDVDGEETAQFHNGKGGGSMRQGRGGGEREEKEELRSCNNKRIIDIFPIERHIITPRR